MIKTLILTTCTRCNGQAYLPLGEAEDSQGRTYMRYLPCPHCAGSGKAQQWVSLQEFNALLTQSRCPHDHASFHGGLRFFAGDVWDDIHEACDDCGASLEG